MNLLHVTNPRAFFLEDFQNFVLKALATDPFVFALDAFVALSKHVAAFDPNVGLFITTDDNGRYIGLAMVGNSTTPLAPGCSVLHFYNEGGNRESRNLLIRAVIEFAKAHGQPIIRGVDTNQKPRAFAKMFGVEGLKPVPMGQVFHFEIEQEEEEPEIELEDISYG